jgi:mannose/cellobiose epimerase-like protein (N-acyl-D-glucosamine 2-epimerase family)
MKSNKVLSNDFLNDYHIANIDSASPGYFGFLRDDGAWYIMKKTTITTVDSFLYCKGVSAYATAWTGRATLSWATFSATF